jgi:hypothetical protein
MLRREPAGATARSGSLRQGGKRPRAESRRRRRRRRRCGGTDDSPHRQPAHRLHQAGFSMSQIHAAMRGAVGGEKRYARNCRRYSVERSAVPVRASRVRGRSSAWR